MKTYAFYGTAFLTLAGSGLYWTACKSNAPAPSQMLTTASTSTPTSTSQAEAGISRDASAPRSPVPARSDVKPPTPEQKRLLRSAIAEGRTLGKAGKWNEAVAAFSKVPEAQRDGVLLSELCYAAYKDGTYHIAEAACSDARGLVHVPQLRAQVLFNSGLVEETSGEWAKAARYYEESLSLRSNATVKKRLDDAKRKMSSKAPKEDCTRAFATPDEACACLVRRRTDYFSPLALSGNAKGLCGVLPKPTATGAKTLRLAPGPGEEGSDMKFLFLAEGSSWKKMPVEVGNYEPGAFGVHNQGNIDHFEEKTVGGHAWLLVHTTVDNADYNMGGLELYASSTALVTPCRLAPKPRCGTSVPLRNEDSLSYEDRGEDMSPEERKEFEALQKTAYKYTYETELVLGDDGESYTVTFKTGDKTKLPQGLLGKHAL